MNSSTTSRKVRTLPSDQDATGRNLGDAEIAAVAEAIRSGTLTSTKGRFVKAFETEFAKQLGVKHAFACSSGSAAVHCAIAVIDPEPGDEIVTTPITDMGALTPILYQGAIPVFADVDPATLNVTAETIEKVLSPRTRAIIVTHLFGTPCEIGPILELAQSRGIPVIEDCAQAFFASYGGKHVGTLGSIGAFSLQQGKHITTGEGGIVTTNDDALARRIFLFINKAWGYGDAQPDHYFVALNYRMSELQGAVALAQLEKLREAVDRRRLLADILNNWLAQTRGLLLPEVPAGAAGVYWKYALRVDGSVIPGGPVGLAKRLREWNVLTAPRYIQKPAFECAVIREKKTFGNSQWPFTLARPEALDYSRAKYPGCYDGLEQVLVVPWNDRYSIEDIEYVAQALTTTVAEAMASTEGELVHA